jgi:PAS domain S-box-containing protein
MQRILDEVQALARVGIWEWDAATDELYWSDELFEILGYAQRDTVPSFVRMFERVHPDDVASVKSHVSRARRERSMLCLEYRLLRPTGELRTIQARTRRVTDAAGGLVRLVGTEQDITETKELAARLVFSDRMISVGTLAGGVAHEINNPLAAISANLELLADTQRGDQRISDALHAVDRIRKIVRGLTAFGRSTEDRRSPLDVDRVLELAIGMTHHEIRHRARLVRHFGSPPLVNANEARLGHVFINLLINAAEAIPEGMADRNEVRITTRSDVAGWAIIEIRDTGTGISPESCNRIFDPFFTTKQVGKGTGLGLSICHGIVRSLGGEIMVRSEVGKGSTFSVVLPPAVVLSVQPAPAASPAITSAHRGHLLIVDDDALFAGSLRRWLAREHEVSVVNSGREALAKFVAGATYDVILCDLMMPELSGPELHDALVQLAPDQAEKIIFITGGAYSPASQQFLERNTNLCFEKPCDLQELRAAVQARVRVASAPA